MSEEHKVAAEQTESTEAGGAASGSSGFSLETVIAQARQIIVDPRTFYRNMAKSGGFSEPLIFMLVMGVVTGAVYGVLSIIGLTGAGAAGLAAIIIMPISLLIGGFISAAVMFVIWKLMGSPEDYQTAYRCVAYTSAILPVVTIVGVIPYVGTIVRVAWGIWLVIIASTEVHGRKEQTARLVFGILGVIGLLMAVSGEYGQRQMQEQLENRAQQMEEQFRSLENLGVGEDGEIDPEQMGRAFGEFIKGMDAAAEESGGTAEPE